MELSMSLFERQGFWLGSSRVVHMSAPSEQQSVIRVARAILKREGLLGRKVGLAIG
jgi:hypothetical protein